jgi:conjugal transfer pilus assembly protein TraB
MDEQSNTILFRQKIYLTLIAAVTVILLWTFFTYVMPSESSVKIEMAKVSLPIDSINKEDLWMTNLENQNKQLESQNQVMQQKMGFLEEILLTNKKKEEKSEKDQINLKADLSVLKQELKKSIDHSSKQASSPPQAPLTQPIPQISAQNPPRSSIQDSAMSFAKEPFGASAPSPTLEKSEVPQLKAPLKNFAMKDNTTKLVPVNEHAPALITIKALLESGVAAECQVDAQSNPIPVKLRLLDDAHLPNGVKVKLKRGLVLASAFAKISSERVYMRLEKLTIVNEKGEAIESQVAGYVSGEDGVYGVRGTVIDRSPKILKNAAASGFLSGISQALQASCTRGQTDNWNTKKYSITGELTQQGVAGASNAFDMMAAYYIARAEQVAPVIQVEAGRIVDITITQGFSLGDLHTQNKIKHVREVNQKKFNNRSDTSSLN